MRRDAEAVDAFRQAAALDTLSCRFPDLICPIVLGYAEQLLNLGEPAILHALGTSAFLKVVLGKVARATAARIKEERRLAV